MHRRRIVSSLSCCSEDAATPRPAHISREFAQEPMVRIRLPPAAVAGMRLRHRVLRRIRPRGGVDRAPLSRESRIPPAEKPGQLRPRRRWLPTRDRWFESASLQQRVVQTSFHVTRPRAPFGSRELAAPSVKQQLGAASLVRLAGQRPGLPRSTRHTWCASDCAKKGGRRHAMPCHHNLEEYLVV